MIHDREGEVPFITITNILVRTEEYRYVMICTAYVRSYVRSKLWRRGKFGVSMEPRNRQPRFRLQQQPFDFGILNCCRNVTILMRTFIYYYLFHLLPQAPKTQNTSYELLTTVCYGYSTCYILIQYNHIILFLYMLYDTG